MTTWLEDVTAKLGRPSFAQPVEVQFGYLSRRCWVWFVDGGNHNVAIERHGRGIVIRAATPHRRCELYTQQEPTDLEIRTACVFVGLLAVDGG